MLKTLLVLSVLLAACAAPVQDLDQSGQAQEETKVLADGTKYLVHPDDLLEGGPPKDGIPSIDIPEFIKAEQADWLGPEEKGAAVVHDGVKRFYPFRILVWHEMVNEKISGVPVLITYCPLCGSVIGFDRRVDGKELEFGVTGKLYNSNLVMYDRETQSYWTQIGGKAIVGELTGHELELFPVYTVSWEEWKRQHPDSEVLSRNTGHSRPYERDPYESYYESESLMFEPDRIDRRLHPKTVVLGVKFNNSAKAYPESAVVKEGKISDRVGGVPVFLERMPSGLVNITGENGETVAYERDFWFAWAAFNPDTELYPD